MPYLQVLFEAAKRISSPLSTDEVLQAIVENTAHAITAKGCSLLLLSPNKERLMQSATYGLSDRYVKKRFFSTDTSLSQALKGQPVQTVNAAQKVKVQYQVQDKKEGIVSILTVPVILNDDVIGVMRVYTSEPRQFTGEEIDFVEGVASLGALALQKAWLHDTISRDLQQCNIDVSRLENEKKNLFRFLSMTAHDLKAPLSAVQTYFGVLLGGFAGEISERQRTIISRCSTRVSELFELISDLLDISKIEAGQVVTEMDEVSLRSIVTRSVQTGRILAEKKGIALQVDTPSKLPRLYAAGGRLQHVLTHLISNAVTYTDEGGSVEVKVIDGGSDIQFQVSDTGIGIPENELCNVFTEFFRASNNIKGKGSGLGVSIAKRVVEAHGGDMWVESPCPDTGKGCRFTFSIPRRTGESHYVEHATAQ
ncbi:MAG: GAF domain-containing sensor histidine kinase [Chloroflexota bacterium]|nr:GAF domain-containing sensor histidine kinase [Chloroflexota bacterium]